MAAPAPSRLDATQVLQGSFDEDTGRLRTDSLATVVNADIDVALDATEDNVAIADPSGDFLAIEADGSINVNSVNGALQTTQQQVLAELVTARNSLNAIESNADLIRISVQSINADFDVALSTRATEVTQLANNQELIDLNIRLETNNNLYSRILPVLSNANWMTLGNFDSIQETFLGNTATLSYKEDNFEIGRATIVFNSPTDWNLTLERYILDDDGTQLLDDDDIPLNLD